jgi:hypothetical protein
LITYSRRTRGLRSVTLATASTAYLSDHYFEQDNRQRSVSSPSFTTHSHQHRSLLPVLSGPARPYSDARYQPRDSLGIQLATTPFITTTTTSSVEWYEIALARGHHICANHSIQERSDVRRHNHFDSPQLVHGHSLKGQEVIGDRRVLAIWQ